MAVVSVKGQYAGGRGVPSLTAMAKGGRLGPGLGSYDAGYFDSGGEWVDTTPTYSPVNNPGAGEAVPGDLYSGTPGTAIMPTQQSVYDNLSLIPALSNGTQITQANNAALYAAIGSALGATVGVVGRYVINKNPPGNGQGYYEIRDPRTGAIQTYVQPLGNTGNILSRQELGGNLSGGISATGGGSTMLIVVAGAFMLMFMLMQQRR